MPALSKFVLMIYFAGSPRLSSYRQILFDVLVSHGQTVVLSIYIEAYPLPLSQNYTWLKCQKNDCVVIKENSTSIILSKGLESFLIVNNVSTADFGTYMVTVSNGIGDQLNQSFQVSKTGNEHL